MFRTLLKYMKVTATAMVWTRIAPSRTRPRHWRDTEMAIISASRREEEEEDKSDQALLHFCSGGKRSSSEVERGGGADGYSSLKMSLL